MIRGIAIMGLNGCGKFTLAHAIGKKMVLCQDLEVDNISNADMR